MIFISVLLYSIKNNNINILKQTVKYFNSIKDSLNNFTIIYILSSCPYITIVDFDLQGPAFLDKFDKTEFKKLLEDQFFNIIKKIADNPVCYSNIRKYDYKYINQIINIKNKSKIDKIIISKIMDTNITNTIEYINYIKHY